MNDRQLLEMIEAMCCVVDNPGPLTTAIYSWVHAHLRGDHPEWLADAERVRAMLKEKGEL